MPRSIFIVEWVELIGRRRELILFIYGIIEISVLSKKKNMLSINKNVDVDVTKDIKVLG